MQKNPCGPRIPDPRQWDSGSRVMDSAFQTHEFHRNGSLIPSKSVDSGFHTMDSGFTLWIPDSKASRLLDSGFLHIGRGEKNISSPLKVTINCVVLTVIGYWAVIDKCRHANFTTETKVKTQILFSSFYRLNRFFQGHISILLRLVVGYWATYCT